MKTLANLVAELRRLLRRPGPDELPAAPARQHLIVAGAAIAITLLIALAILTPHLDSMRARERAAQPKPCAPGQTQGCIGGTMGVVVVTPSAASAPR